jgi:hypothetical protein
VLEDLYGGKQHEQAAKPVANVAYGYKNFS